MKVFDFDPREDSKRNYVINGNFDFWQRGTSATRTAGNGGYLADRFYNLASTGASKSVTVARSTSVPSSLPYPASYSAELTNNTIVSSFATGEYINGFEHIIEGFVASPLSGGYVTLGFWLYCTSSMTFPVALRDGVQSFSYATTITTSAGWGYYAVSLPLSPITIPNSSARGLDIIVGAVSGATYQAPTLNSWLSGNYISHASATNWAASTGVIFRLAQVQLRQGIVSPDDMKNSFSTFGVTYNNELMACQRYYEKTFALETAPVQNSGTNSPIWVTGQATNTRITTNWWFKTEKRATPVITTYSPNGLSANWYTNGGITPTANIPNNDRYSAAIAATTSIAAGNDYFIHATADAEF